MKQSATVERAARHRSMVVAAAALTAVAISLAVSALPVVISAALIVLPIIGLLVPPEFPLSICLVGTHLLPTLFEFLGLGTTQDATLALYLLLSGCYLLGFRRRSRLPLHRVVTAPGFVALGLLAAWMATSWALFSADSDFATRK